GNKIQGTPVNSNTTLTFNYRPGTGATDYNIYSKTDKIKGNLNVDAAFDATTNAFKPEDERDYYDLTKGCFDIMGATNAGDGMTNIIPIFFKDFDGAPVGERTKVLE